MKKARKRKMISVVVPVFNERANIGSFLTALLKALASIKTPYEIIFIDDHSTDGTYQYLTKIAKTKRSVFVFQKIGKRGKAFSLLEGFLLAKGSIFVMIDGDLQYPPLAISEMIGKLSSSDIVVANRRWYKAPVLRKILSRGFKICFGRMLFKLPYDIQSGLKVFKAEVFHRIFFKPQSQWTFDLEFLYKASHAGFSISQHDIVFSERPGGSSKLHYLKTPFEIGINALIVKLTRTYSFLIHPQTKSSMRGAGIVYKGKTYITHSMLPLKKSALKTVTKSQKIFLSLILFDILYGFFHSPFLMLQILLALLSVIYFLDVVFNLFLVLKSLNRNYEIVVPEKELVSLSDKNLPVYTILCPLYKEAHIIQQFLQAIEKLDWPKEKLDLILLLEEDDATTIAKTQAMDLPSYVSVLVVPDSMPKTKPKACNFGLSFAKGKYLVVYDCEDIPDPLQLKKAYLTFKRVPDDVICLQAKLNYYNPNQNLLTKLFTAEYSLWFDVTLTGLQAIQASIPLGGTSNHFRTKDLVRLFGWDPFNVTEDADLGVRLFKEGYKTAIIDSTTYEEANSKILNWIRQRSRWIKGYMQTYLVHMRDFPSFVRSRQLQAFVFQLTIGGKLAFIFINPLLWATTISYFVSYRLFGPTIESLYLTPVYYISVFSLVFGNFLFLYYYMVGLAKRSSWYLIKYIYLVPFYWLFISISGFVAFYQLLFKPHYWEKTVHGFHLVPAASPPALSLFIRRILPPPILNPFGLPSTCYLFLSQIVRSNIRALMGLFRAFDVSASGEGDKLNILMFNWRDTMHERSGGAEVYVHEVAKRWVENGFRVTLFCGNDKNHKNNNHIDGVEIVRRGGLYTVYLWAFLYYLIKFRGKYDVIIDCENGIPFFTPLYVNKPIILLIHHIHRDVFKKHLSFPLSSIGIFLETVVMPLVYRNKPVVTVSDSSKKEIVNIGLAKPRDIEVIPPGITMRNYRRYKKTTNPSYVYLGRLKPYKNIDHAILAFEKILPEFPKASLSIVGEGESMHDLQELVVKRNLTKHVKFFGRVSEQQKAHILGKSWMLLQPSMIEGWGITVIEANACGTPVIAAKVQGLKDSVLNRKTGLLVEAGDIQSLSLAMRQLTVERRFREKLSYEAYLWAKQFNWEESAESLFMLISNTLTKKFFATAYERVVFSRGE